MKKEAIKKEIKEDIQAWKPVLGPIVWGAKKWKKKNKRKIDNWVFWIIVYMILILLLGLALHFIIGTTNVFLTILGILLASVILISFIMGIIMVVKFLRMKK